jgi:hypothetical protein
MRLNLSLASAYTELSRISLWKHQGFWAAMECLAADGVHML